MIFRSWKTFSWLSTFSPNFVNFSWAGRIFLFVCFKKLRKKSFSYGKTLQSQTRLLKTEYFVIQAQKNFLKAQLTFIFEILEKNRLQFLGQGGFVRPGKFSVLRIFSTAWEKFILVLKSVSPPEQFFTAWKEFFTAIKK